MTPAPSHAYTEAIPVCWHRVSKGSRDPEGSIWITIFHLPRMGQWVVARESRHVVGIAAQPVMLYRGYSSARALDVARHALRVAAWREFDDIRAAAAANAFTWDDLAAYTERLMALGTPGIAEEMFG